MAAPRPTVAVGAVIQDDHGRLLAVQRGHPPAEGRWTLPGGRVEPGETLEEAVAREVAEETSLTIAVGSLVGVTEFRNDAVHYVILDYQAEITAGTPSPRSDVTDVRWMTRQELTEAGPTDGLLDFLDRHGVVLAD